MTIHQRLYQNMSSHIPKYFCSAARLGTYTAVHRWLKSHNASLAPVKNEVTREGLCRGKLREWGEAQPLF